MGLSKCKYDETINRRRSFFAKDKTVYRAMVEELHRIASMTDLPDQGEALIYRMRVRLVLRACGLRGPALLPALSSAP